MSDVLEPVMAMTMQRVVVQGRVQGVGFRAWVSSNARKRGLKGWVRNLSNGAVEAVFAGEPDLVEQMVKDCWDGPLVSRVLSVIAEPCQEAVGDYFEQKPTV
jgi:acylphosphatase